MRKNLTFYHEGKKLKLHIDRYTENNRTAICLMDATTEEPFAVLTVNIGEIKLKEDEFLVKTWSENAPVVESARDSGLFENTLKSFAVGYHNCFAEVWKFSKIVELSEEAKNVLDNFFSNPESNWKLENQYLELNAGSESGVCLVSDFNDFVHTRAWDWSLFCSEVTLHGQGE